MVFNEGSGHISVLDLSDQPSFPWLVGRCPNDGAQARLYRDKPFPPTAMSAFLIGGLLGLAVGVAIALLQSRSNRVSRVRVFFTSLIGLRPIRVVSLPRVPASRR